MTTPIDRIENSEAITSLFGYWPSFHDAEVIQISISRFSEHGGAPSLSADVHVFEMTRQLNSDTTFATSTPSLPFYSKG